MKILIADDDSVLRAELAGLLRDDGHDVVGASDGGEALRLVERESFDAALLDLRMPKASGLEVLHRLRVTRPGTAVVVITGQGTIDAAVEAMKAGATDFVEKPYEVDALRRTLRTVQEEQHARTLLGASAADGAVVRVLSDAVARRALLAVVGPRADPPSGATRVFRVEEEGRPPIAFAPNQLYQLNTAIEAHIAGVDPEEEFRGLVVQALLPPPETPVGWTPREKRRRPVRGDGSGPAGLAGRPRARRTEAALSPDLEIVTPGRHARPHGLSSRLNWAV